jgi:hypothetical protein
MDDMPHASRRRSVLSTVVRAGALSLGAAFLLFVADAVAGLVFTASGNNAAALAAFRGLRARSAGLDHGVAAGSATVLFGR